MAEERLGASFSIDINNLKAGLSTANKLIRESQSEFKAAAAGLDNWTRSEEGLTARNKMLTQQIDIQREKVKKLAENYQKELAAGMDESSDRAIYLRTQLNNEEAALRRNEAELNRNTKALEELGDEAEETGNDIEKSGSAWEKFGNAAQAAAKVALTAVAAIGTGVVALTKSAVEAYADYEQLIGGVETLFGAGGKSVEEYAKSVGKSVSEVQGEYNNLMEAQDLLIKNANDAYKTAGMSANDYMQNVTSFSASLIASLGGDTKAATAAADRAMRDISDNANKMGTDMQMIVDTYQSLARGNFQMLDNLKVGYGGTKAEMERMIADAAKMTDIQKELNITVKEGDTSFSNMVNAISVVQKKMGITGTTALEAEKTISGSVGAMKAAWQNLLVGVADDTQDFDQLINNFVDSFGKAANNLLPRVATALKGIVKLVENLVPHIPPLLQELLPVVVDGVMNVVKGLVEAFPDIIDTILDVVPQLLDALISMLPTIQSAILDIVIKIIDSLADVLPDIVSAIMKVVPQLIKNLIAAIPKLLQAAIKFLMAIVQAIPTIVKELMKELPTIIDTLITTLMDAIPMVLESAIQLLRAIIDAIPIVIQSLVESLPTIIESIINALFNPDTIQSILDGAIQLLMAIVEAIPVIIEALVGALPTIIETLLTALFNPDTFQKIIDGAIQLLMGIIKAIPTIIEGLINALPTIISTIVNTLLSPSNFKLVLDGAIQLLMGIIKAIPQIIVELVKNLPQIIKSIVTGLLQGIPEMFKVGGDLIKGLWNGIKDAGAWLAEKIGGFFGGIVDNIKKFFGIASPSKLMENLIGKNLALGIGEGFTDEMKSVNKDIMRSLSDLKNIDVGSVNSSLRKSLVKEMQLNVNGSAAQGRSITVNQYNTYSQAHSRYEIYKSKQETAAAVRLALGTV